MRHETDLTPLWRSEQQKKGRWLRACSRALWESDLIASRLTLFLAEMLWAIMLLWPGDTFGRPTYTAMTAAAREEIWAFVFIFSAFVQLYIVVNECYTTAFTKIFTGWNAALWIYVVIGMLGSVYPPPAAIGGEIALAILATWIFIRPFFLEMMYRRAYERGL